VTIQKNFLWGGGAVEKKMCWVSWDRICQPKNKRGLGLKNLELFNSSLLCKWKWRCFVDKEAPWRELLSYRYGGFAENFLYGEGKENLKKSSIWWRDLWSLGGENDGGWFGANFSSVLGNGNDIGFWKEKWIGTTTLKSLYPDLYHKSSLQSGTVSMMGSRVNNVWEWKFDWTEPLSDVEAGLELELLNMLFPFQPRPDAEDRYRWIPSTAGFFWVKSAYSELVNSTILANLEDLMVHSLRLMWKNNFPSKVSVFGWRLLLEKLPTKDALFNKGIITINTERRRVLCSNQNESFFHVFVQCNFSATVWRNFSATWLGLNLIISTSVQHHFLLFGDLVKSKVNKRHRHIIWLATMWCIWRRRNNIVFREDRATIFSTVNQIIYMSWFWFSGRLRSNVDITFDYWCTNPLDCLQNI
jgi:hypothetical protein